MDMQMPVMDGYTAAEEIRKYEKFKNLKRSPIVGFSAFSNISEQKKALESGCDNYLYKPVKKMLS